MKIVKYIAKAVEFLKSFNRSTKSNSRNNANLELTYTKFGLISKLDKDTAKTSNYLMSQLYSEENDTLFI